VKWRLLVGMDWRISDHTHTHTQPVRRQRSTKGEGDIGTMTFRANNLRRCCLPLCSHAICDGLPSAYTVHWPNKQLGPLYKLLYLPDNNNRTNRLGWHKPKLRDHLTNVAAKVNESKRKFTQSEHATKLHSMTH